MIRENGIIVFIRNYMVSRRFNGKLSFFRKILGGYRWYLVSA